MQKTRMRVYTPDWNTNFMDHLPAIQRPAAPGEEVKQVVIVPLPYTKQVKKKAGVK